MTYLLDTCVVIDLARGNAQTIEQLKTKSPSQVFISTITELELRYGLAQNPGVTSKSKATVSSFLSEVTIVTFGSVEANIAAKLRYDLRVTGQPIGAYDILIAATALAHATILVTSNEREFQRVPNLTMENWRG